MDTSGIRIGIMCPGFTPPTMAELVKFRGNTNRQREEGLMRAIMIKLGAVPTGSLLTRDGKTVIMTLPVRAETDPPTLKRAVKRFASAGWLCEVRMDTSTGKQRPVVQFYGGQGATRPLELDFGLNPPSPEQFAAFRSNATDPWTRVEGVVLALWQILAKHTKFRAEVPLQDRVNNRSASRRRIRPAFADVVRGVEERFEQQGWWTQHHSGWFHVAEELSID